MGLRKTVLAIILQLFKQNYHLHIFGGEGLPPTPLDQTLRGYARAEKIYQLECCALYITNLSIVPYQLASSLHGGFLDAERLEEMCFPLLIMHARLGHMLEKQHNSPQWRVLLSCSLAPGHLQPCRWQISDRRIGRVAAPEYPGTPQFLLQPQKKMLVSRMPPGRGETAREKRRSPWLMRYRFLQSSVWKM